MLRALALAALAVDLAGGDPYDFDCDAHPYPVQIYKPDGSDGYVAAELDIDDGSYTQIYDLGDSFEINAAAIHRRSTADGDKFAVFATVQKLGPGGARSGKKRLCLLGPGGPECDVGFLHDSTTIKGTFPTSGAIIGDTYYYGNLGKQPGEIYSVGGLDSFWSEPKVLTYRNHQGSNSQSNPLAIDSANKWNPGVNDFTQLVEDGATTLIRDDVVGSYLVGVDSPYKSNPKLVLLLVDADAGVVLKYAAIPTVVTGDFEVPDGGEACACDADAGCAPCVQDCCYMENGGQLHEKGWGAASTYGAGADTRVFFAANSGDGLFELEIPPGGIEVPAACWNDASDGVDHGLCVDEVDAAHCPNDEAGCENDQRAYLSKHQLPRLVYTTSSGVSTNNDGFMCPDGVMDIKVVGCDGVAGSGLASDACGVCDGPCESACDVCGECDGTETVAANCCPDGQEKDMCYVCGGTCATRCDACGVCDGDGSSCDGAISCADATYASPLQLLRCIADDSTDAACAPASADTPVAESVLRLVALDVGEGRHAKVFDYDTAGWFNGGAALGSSAGDDTRHNANSAGMLHVASRARIDRRFGTSRPNFEMLSLGHIDVDSADFWTDRWLFSSSRSATEVFECAHVEVGSKIRRARGPSPPLGSSLPSMPPRAAAH